MHRTLLSLILFALSLPAFSQVYKDANAKIEDRIEDLNARMTIAEKIGQMTHPYVKVIPPDLEERIRNNEVGSLLKGMTSFFSPSERNRYQRIAIEESRQRQMSQFSGKFSKTIGVSVVLW